jgi:1A family penicillin-binding protein
VGTISIVGLYFWVAKDLPEPNRLMERQVIQNTKIYDRTGETILYEISGNVKRTLVDLDDIPKHLKDATVVIEDKDFYNHGGISFWAIFRTAVMNVVKGQKAGGSTLTQQFIKNAVLSTEKSYLRKIKEAILAVRLEKDFSKDEILQMYLNEIPYGSTAYGVEAASQLYFGKNVQQINLPEAAILAALPQSPSRYSPYGSRKETLLARQKYILDLMVKHGYIDSDQAEVAKNVKLVFKEPSNQINSPHFVLYVKELLTEKYGEKMVEQEGLKIYTTLDLYKQKAAEEVIQKYGQANHDKYDASNAALVTIDPKTGQILAMVGSRDFNNEEIDGQVNMVTSLRQPGSSIKPLIYAAAFMKGFTANTVVYDVITNFSTDPANPYEPNNYSNNESGPVSLKKALAGSLNIPAVKALYLAGMDNVLDLAKQMGYSSFGDKSKLGLSLVLGGGEVRMLEHVNAFSAFAREGSVLPVTPILKITDKNGKVLEEFQPSREKKVFDAGVARQVNDILSDNAARSYVFGANSQLNLPNRTSAVKTGTTNDYRDAWTVGYTPSVVTGVWVGNNNYSPMKRGSAAATIAVPIWHDYMVSILGNTPAEEFKKDPVPTTGKAILDGTNIGEVRVKIDRASGLLATDYTPETYIEERVYRQAHSILYYVDKNDPRGSAPANPFADPQFVLWESRIQAWAEKQGYSSSTPPTEYDNLHVPENLPSLSIVQPTQGQSISEPQLYAKVETSAPRGVSRVEYYVDDNLLSQETSQPFDLSRQVDFLGKGLHVLKVRACDDIDNCSEQRVEFNLQVDESRVNDSFTVRSLNLADSELQASDFPLTVGLELVNSRNISRVQAILVSEDGSSQIVASYNLLANDYLDIVINQAPPLGQYKLYAKATGWNGQTAQTGRVSLVIK